MVCFKNVITGVLALCICVSVQAEYVYTTLDVPGASSTYAYDIDGGNIVGYYSDSLGYHGFSYDGTTYTTLDGPGASQTFALGNDGSNIVGEYLADGYHHGFIVTIPEPTTLPLLAAGLLMVCRRRRVTLSLPSRR